MFNGNHHGTTFEDRIDNLADNLKHVAEYVSTHAESFKDKAGDARGYARSYVAKAGEIIKDHPIASLAIAFGLGYAVTRLVRR